MRYLEDQILLLVTLLVEMLSKMLVFCRHDDFGEYSLSEIAVLERVEASHRLPSIKFTQASPGISV